MTAPPPVLIVDPDTSPVDLGFTPGFLDLDDPRPAREQFHANYQHGGGWRPQAGFTPGNWPLTLNYPGDPPLKPIAVIPFRKEIVVMYPHGYVAIYQADRSFEVCRMD